MWSTELVPNGFNQVPTSTQTSLDDLDDIEFSFHGAQGQKSGKKLQTARHRHEILDVWSRANHGSDRIDKLSLHQSLSLPATGMRKSDSSIINASDKLTAVVSQQTIRTVEITRTSKDPLGFFIRQGDGHSNKAGIFISRVTKGSLVDCGGLLKVGDQILNINEVDIKGYSLTDVVQLIQVQTRLILTLRTVNRCQGFNRPGIYSRHSSPSLAKEREKNLQQARHSKDDCQPLTTNNMLKCKQKEQFSRFSDKSNANEFDSSDLSKNTSTIDELIRLLRAHTDEQNCSKKEELKSPSPRKHSDNTAKKDPVDITNPDFLPTQTNYEPRKISTITPVTAVDLVFDDEDMGAASKSQHNQHSPSKSYHPYHRIRVTKSQGNASFDEQCQSQLKEDTKLNVTYPPRSRSSSHGSHGSGSGGDSSPKPRRRLPSLPTEDINKRRDSNFSIRAMTMDHKPRRKLPTPPASPVMQQRHLGSHLHPPQNRRQKTLSWGGPESGSLTEIKELIADSKAKDKNNNSSKQEESLAKPSNHEHEPAVFSSMGYDEPDGKQEGKYTARHSVVYRRSKSQHSDFFEQQRHSMFLQSFASGKNVPGSTRNTASLSLSLDYTDMESFKDTKSDLVHSPPRNATLKIKSREGSPAMRRHASSSLLFRRSRDTSPATSHGKVESDPGFTVFPDDYKDIDLTCSHAVSGMMKVRIIKAANLNSIDKKKYKKICCAVEVDFERKASTLQKKVSRNPSWDEEFEIEIQHGREMTFLCYGSKKEFDKPIARASFYLTPLVRQSKAHQFVIRLAPEGLLYIELEFTEIKALLRRTPSSKNSGIFGFNLSVTSEQEQCDVPLIVRKCVSEIEKRGLETVGLYRISGNARKKERLKVQFEENSQTADISADNCPDINIVAGILKDYLRELPEPLITDRMSQQLINGVEENVQEREAVMKKKFLSKLLSELPTSNKKTLAFILSHLCHVVNNLDNKMDSRNLSVCLAPVLQYSPTNLSEPKDLLGLKTFLKAVEVLIDMWNDVESMERMDRDSRLLHV